MGERMALSDDGRFLLKAATRPGGVFLNAAHIVEAAELLKAGFAAVDNDDVGIIIWANDAGLEEAKRLGLISGDG